jgi:hypothetical protein
MNLPDSMTADHDVRAASRQWRTDRAIIMPVTTRLMIPATPYPGPAEDGRCGHADRCADASEPRSGLLRREPLQQAGQCQREWIEHGVSSGLGQALTSRQAAGFTQPAHGHLR